MRPATTSPTRVPLATSLQSLTLVMCMRPSLAGAGASQIGIGVNLAAVQQQFTQGNITSTNNPLDISINGAGFFQMDQNGATTYTRNGQFHLDKNGFIINDQNMKLTGYPAQSGIVVPSTPAPIQISAADLAPIATGASTSNGFTGVKGNINLDSRKTEPSVAWNSTTPASANAAAVAAYYASQGVTAATASPAQIAAATAAGSAAAAAAAISAPDPQSYNYSTALSVYDTLGNPHTLTMFFEKVEPPTTPNTGEWKTHFTVDGTNESFVTGSGGNLVFNNSGKLISPANGVFNLNIDLAGAMTALGTSNSALTPAGIQC